MTDWWEGLQRREQGWLLAGGAVALVLLAYAWLWAPLQGRVDRLQAQVTEKQELLQWMRRSAAEVRQLRAMAGRAPRRGVGRSLLAMVDESAKAQGLAGGLRRVEPEGGTGVRVWLEQVGFSELAYWVQVLAQDYGLRVTSLSVERQDAPGRVNVRVLLERGS